MIYRHPDLTYQIHLQQLNRSYGRTKYIALKLICRTLSEWRTKLLKGIIIQRLGI